MAANQRFCAIIECVIARAASEFDLCHFVYNTERRPWERIGLAADFFHNIAGARDCFRVLKTRIPQTLINAVARGRYYLTAADARFAATATHR